MVLVTQSFGTEYEYKRAIFAIESFYAHANNAASIETFLFTDNPSFFEPYFRCYPIRYFLLSKEKMRTMRGDIDFLHRMKIAIIEEALNESKDKILYIDSDTFFISDPLTVVGKINENISSMHLCEYEFGFLREMKLPAGKTFLAFLDGIIQNEFLMANGNRIKISVNLFSWNAGAIMLHPLHIKYIPDVYKLTEQFYGMSDNHASEQYAFSIALQTNTKIIASDSVIYHYWYRVKKALMDDYLLFRINDGWQNLTIADRTRLVREWTAEIPAYFNNHILFIRDQAIQSFHEKRYWKGYKLALTALTKDPLHHKFWMDILHHTKRFIFRLD